MRPHTLIILLIPIINDLYIFPPNLTNITCNQILLDSTCVDNTLPKSNTASSCDPTPSCFLLNLSRLLDLSTFISVRLMFTRYYCPRSNKYIGNAHFSRNFLDPLYKRSKEGELPHLPQLTANCASYPSFSKLLSCLARMPQSVGNWR